MGRAGRIPGLSAALLLAAALGCGRVSYDGPEGAGGGSDASTDGSGQGDGSMQSDGSMQMDAPMQMDGSAPPDAARDAAVPEVTRVWSGSLTLAQGELTRTVTVDPFAPERTFLIFTVTGDSAAPRDLHVTGRVATSTAIIFQRPGSDLPVDIAWFLVTSPALFVQRGTSPVPGQSIDVPIVAVDLAASFPLISFRTGGNNFDETDWVRAELTDAQTLHLGVPTNGDMAPVAEWQVIEVAGARVESGSLGLQTTDLFQTATLTSAPDPTRSSLFYSFTADQEGTVPDIGQKLVLGTIDSPTELRFDRVHQGTSSQITWYVVEWPAGAVVHASLEHLDPGLLDVSPTIPAVPLDTTFATVGSMIGGGSCDEDLDDNPGSAWATVSLPSADTVSVVRGNADVPGHIGWFVVSLP